MDKDVLIATLSKFIDANKLGGWVRAGVASLLGLLIGKFPGLSSFLDPVTQQALGVAISGIIVGAWSQATKTDAAKVAMVSDLAKDPNSAVKGVITTNDAAGAKLAASIEGPVESAGTTAASEISKT